MSHPVWVRGLKLIECNYRQDILDVAPRVGAWIETLRIAPPILKFESHPVWVRGLKPSSLDNALKVISSHPVWVRGLKP